LPKTPKKKKKSKPKQRAWPPLLVLLSVAAGAFAAGAIADNAIFWGAAAGVFLMATAGLVAWAVTGLKILPQTRQLLRAGARSGQDGDS
jgi:hypothetical protein